MKCVSAFADLAAAFAASLHDGGITHGYAAAAQINAESRWCVTAMRSHYPEYGCGLTQVSKVLGRFDNLTDYANKYAALSGWGWHNCTDERYQLKFYRLFVNDTCRSLPKMADAREQMALCFAAYNAGKSGIERDREICAMTKDCYPSRWFGNIENITRRSAMIPGTNRRAWQITRAYVAEIMGSANELKFAIVDTHLEDLRRTALVEKEMEKDADPVQSPALDSATRVESFLRTIWLAITGRRSA